MKLVKQRFDWDHGWRNQIDVEYGIDLSVTNDTEFSIELVKTSCLLFSNSRVSIGGGGGAYSEEDIYMDPGETSQFSVNVDNPFLSAISGVEDSISAEVCATFFAKEFVDLGEMSVPDNEKSSTQFEGKVTIAHSDFSIMGGVVFIEPSEDADRTVTANVGIKNSGAEMLQKVIIRLALFDRDGQQIEQSEVEEFLAPHSCNIASPRVYTKAGRLRGASVKISATFFKAVGSGLITLKDPEKRKQ
jgi:hypothetical protein